MHNPSPMEAFNVDVGRKENALYGLTADECVVELVSHKDTGMSVVRVWEPEIGGKASKFNPYLVDGWSIEVEQWFSRQEKKFSARLFEKISSNKQSRYLA